jgi:hypothetical protein
MNFLKRAYFSTVKHKVRTLLLTISVSIVQQQDKEDSQDVSKIIEDSQKSTLLGKFDNTTAKLIDKMNIVISPAEIAEFSLFGLIIVIVSVSVPLVRIIMLKPMAILSRKE